MRISVTFRLVIFACVLLVPGSRASVFSAEDLHLTVMTYNVLYGAGVNTENERIANNSSNGKYHGNRLDKVIAVIKAANPDILGIQEACAWDNDDEDAAKQFAKALGMHYFVGKSGHSRFHVALFSKYPIISAKNFPDQFSRAAIQAEIKLPDGRILHTFVAHFNLPRSGEEQLKEIRYLAKQMRPHAFDLAVMMGDTNMWYREGRNTSDALRASGFVMAPSIKGIDQIWMSRLLAQLTEAGSAIPPEIVNGVSDHMPSVVKVAIPANKDTKIPSGE